MVEATLRELKGTKGMLNLNQHQSGTLVACRPVIFVLLWNLPEQ